MGWGTGSRPTNVVRAKNSSTVLSSTPLAEDEEGRAELIGLFRGVDMLVGYLEVLIGCFSPEDDLHTSSTCGTRNPSRRRMVWRGSRPFHPSNHSLVGTNPAPREVNSRNRFY